MLVRAAATNRVYFGGGLVTKILRETWAELVALVFSYPFYGFKSELHTLQQQVLLTPLRFMLWC